MFLKNSMRASRSIRARIAFIASCAVTTGAECVLAPKTINVGNLVGSKYPAPEGPALVTPVRGCIVNAKRCKLRVTGCEVREKGVLNIEYRTRNIEP